MEQINSQWSLKYAFQEMRNNKNTHLGLGDIRLTMGMQEEMVKLSEKEKIDFAIRELMWVNARIPFADQYAKDLIYKAVEELEKTKSQLWHNTK